MPGAVDLGALRDEVRTAVVAVEQAVQRVHGGGAHDVAVLENAAHAGRVVEDVEARVAKVAGHAELQRGRRREDVVAPADHSVGLVLPQPITDRGGGIRPGDD